MGLSTSVGNQAAQLQQQQQQQLDSSLSTINSAFAGFTPDYFNKVGQDYQNFATPQLEQQFQQQNKQLTGSLESQGITHSSAANELSDQLTQNLKQAQAGIADTGLQQEQGFQQQVQQQQNTLISQAEAASDPLSIAQGALGQAASIKAPSLFAPVGNFFSNWATTYGAQQQANASEQTNQLLNNAISSGFAGNQSFGLAPIGGAGGPIL